MIYLHYIPILSFPNQSKTKTTNLFNRFQELLQFQDKQIKGNQDNINIQIKQEIYSNIYIIIEPFSQFLLHKLQIPDIQRIIVQERIDEYVQKIQDHYEDYQQGKHKELIPYLGLLSIGMIDTQYNILDGQHRFRAYESFYNKYKTNTSSIDFNIQYSLKICQSSEEILQYFYQLNCNTPLPESVLNELFADTRRKVISYLTLKYPKHISNSTNANFPRFHMDKLIDYLFKTIPKSCRDNSTKVIELIELWNNNLDEILSNDFPERWKQASNLDKFYLAHYLRKTEYKRLGLNKNMRDKLWNNKFDDDIGECACCCEQINRLDYVIGHIIARSKGGSDDISNLDIICQSCNNGMGTTNMITYRDQFFGSRQKNNNLHIRMKKMKEY